MNINIYIYTELIFILNIEEKSFRVSNDDFPLEMLLNSEIS